MPAAILEPFVTHLRMRHALSTGDAAALRGLPHAIKTFSTGSHLIREGDRAVSTHILLTGFAFRQKVVVDGGRQIVGIQVPGDPVDLHNSMLKFADHAVQALTDGTAAVIPRSAIVALAAAFPAIGVALWIDTLVDGSIAREWIVNIGRRDARSRLAHLLCEFAVRLKTVQVGADDTFHLPMTQEQLADALGLTTVHVNRTIRELEADGLIARDKRTMAILQTDRLRTIAGFNDAYLHLDLLDD